MRLPTQPAGSGLIYPDPPNHACGLPGLVKISPIVMNKLEHIEKVTFITKEFVVVLPQNRFMKMNLLF